MKHLASSPTPELVTLEPEFNPVRGSNQHQYGDICDKCPKLKECRERVANDGPTYCELWDEEDVFIVWAKEMA